jgi:multidrug resistance efflux pump
MKNYLKYLLTGAIILVAIIVVLVKYGDYVSNPWTRNGQVRAEVIQLTPRVSGPIVNLPIKDNQFVKAGDLLFEIDPRTYEVSLAHALAQLDGTGDDVLSLEKQVEAAKAAVEMSKTTIQQAQSSIDEFNPQLEKNKAEYERQILLLARGATSQKGVDQAKTNYDVAVEQKKGALASRAQAEASVRQAEASLAQSRAKLGELGENNAQLRAALAAVKQAQLNLGFTQVRAPVDGYVTNLNLRKGSQTNAGQPALALVDVNSYWIDGFFKETLIEDIKPGDQAVVTLMSYPDSPVEGIVESIGWGISQQDGSTGFELLPNVNPTFEWIRLAQRVPVHIKLVNKPKSVELRIGTTASVLVLTGETHKTSAKALPSALQ